MSEKIEISSAFLDAIAEWSNDCGISFADTAKLDPFINGYVSQIRSEISRLEEECEMLSRTNKALDAKLKELEGK